MTRIGTPAWSSKLAFLLAAIGAAVGIGNIWRFPYLTGTSGGGAFVLIYVACVAVVALPLLIAELTLGRRAGLGPPHAMRVNAALERRSPAWLALGWLFLLTGFLILSFFSVVGGWILDYGTAAFCNRFAGVDAVETHRRFERLLADPVRMSAWHTAFMLINVAIVSLGVRRGIERVSAVLLPALVGILIILCAYSLSYGAAAQALQFLLAFDFAAVNREVLVAAIGQAFLSIGLCSGMMMIYGAYLSDRISIPQTAVLIVVADTLVALLAGLVIFPLVFAYGLAPAQGPGLIFETLPIAFAQMPLGYVFGCAFFVLLTLAAVTSSIALLEQVVFWMTNAFALSRRRSALVAGSAAWLLGHLSVLSFNRLAGLRPLGFIPGFENRGIFEIVDFATTGLFMLAGGLLMAVFTGWHCRRTALQAELAFPSPAVFSLWRWLLRYVAPATLVLVLASNFTGL